ncbi:hypothetical protein HDV00_009530 [Rhizophlyctis rosea]|nr:hypothetical protein HDV00_009530 [Rhizophlyctis rosea]
MDFFNMTGQGTSAVFLLQFAIVLYMWLRVGRGLYWTILLCMSIAGLIATSLENLAQILYNYTNGMNFYYLCIVSEPCWIISEFGVVALNLIKLKTLMGRRIFGVMCVLQSMLFFAFCACRIRIGINRFKLSMLNSEEIWQTHSPAFGLTAAAELLCTIAILTVVVHQIRSERDMATRLATHKHLFGSSFFVLLIVDLVGVMLAITSNLAPDLQELLAPFLAIKSAFALILASDNLVIKLILQHGAGRAPPSAFTSNDSSYRSGNAPRTPYNTYQTASAMGSLGTVSISSVDRRFSGGKGKEKSGTYGGAYGVVSRNGTLNGGEDSPIYVNMIHQPPSARTSTVEPQSPQSPRMAGIGGVVGNAEMIERKDAGAGMGSRAGSVVGSTMASGTESPAPSRTTSVNGSSRPSSLVGSTTGGGWASRNTSVTGSMSGGGGGSGYASRSTSVNSVVGRNNPDSRSSSPALTASPSPAFGPSEPNFLARLPPLGEEGERAASNRRL